MLTVATFVFHNDHFHRISSARQISAYGGLPFRDFFDPGYFGPELASAAFQRLLGDNLLGEVVLTTFFVATGTVVVFRLVTRLSSSVIVAGVAAMLSLLLLPRAYDYDKVLFYPLGLLLIWRYVERPSAPRLWSLAAGLVAAALFRYDTGVYIGVSALVAMGLVHAGAWRTTAQRAALLAAASFVLALPVLVFIQLHGGLAEAVDQMITYGRKETARTKLSTPGRFTLMDEPPSTVLVRWSASVDDRTRDAAETRHGLMEGVRHGAPADRTWEYRLGDPSTGSIRALLEDPAVEDTGGIDRAGLRLAEPYWARAWRAFPSSLRWLPASIHTGNADIFLYHLFRLLPLGGALALALGVARGRRGLDVQMAEVTSLLTMCLLLNLFILRDPVGARIGGMAGPAAVLAAWLATRAWHVSVGSGRIISRAAVVALLMLTVWSVSESADWRRRVATEVVRPARVSSFLEQMAASPPSLEALPNRKLAGLVQYLRECTGRNDRILATWFAPEIYFFAQRGFAAGIVALFGEHWSEPRFEHRSVQILEGESTPMVIVLRSTDESVRQNYPTLVAYLDEHYANAGSSTFGDPDIDDGGYTVLIRRDRKPDHLHVPTSMPCFW